MPAPLLATQMTDLVAMTLRNLGKPNIVEIATDTQDHVAWNELLKQSRVVVQSGTGAQWDVMVQHSQSSSNVGLGAQDDVNIADTTVQAQADWRNTVTSYGFIGQEKDMNREPQRIVDLVRVRRASAMISNAEKYESNFFGPPVASTDEVTPWGLKTWIVKNATTGFNGGAPSGFTTIGLNPSTYTRWKNYTAQYTAVSNDDFFRKIREAATKTNFKQPVGVSLPNMITGSARKYLTNYSCLRQMEEYLDTRNDNLGVDVAKHDGMVTFRRILVQWVPKLDADTTDPFYGLHWDSFKTIVLSGWWMRETNLPHYPGQHTVDAHFLDSTYQICCYNRRNNFVVATGTTEPS